MPKVRGHGLCDAHHLRELAAVTDLDGQRSSQRMTNLLLEMLAYRNAAMEAKRSGLEPELVEELGGATPASSRQAGGRTRSGPGGGS